MPIIHPPPPPQPGTASRVAVERSVLHRREYPYPSRCVRDWSETGLGRMVGASVGDADYVQATCNRMCLLHFVIVDCDCIWHQVRIKVFNKIKMENDSPSFNFNF